MHPSSGATYERARRLANVYIWAISVQCRRLTTSEPEDEAFIFRKWSDFGFLVVALTRLRRAATLASRIPELKASLSAALSAFDATVPNLKQFRDVAEHIDDYARDQGKRKNVARQSLEVSTLSADGKTLSWLGHTLNADEALVASESLFKTLQDGISLLSRKA
jgi:hypothetical protein